MGIASNGEKKGDEGKDVGRSGGTDFSSLGERW